MRSKLFRIGFGVSLAVFMGMAGVFGGLVVLPKTVLAESESFSAGAGGLIVPKADDPVVFTTESGLDIKYGNNLPDTYGESLSTSESGLSGFPYFTTNDGTKEYTWVIIGQSTNMSKVKGKPNPDSTPAGLAIKNDLNFDYEEHYGAYIRNITINAEISANSVLVLANTAVASGNFCSETYIDTNARGDIVYGNKYDISQCAIVMEGYYANNSLGLGVIKSSIKSLTLTTYEHYWISTGEGYHSNTIQETHIFSLSNNDNSSFNWSQYLTSSQIKLNNNQWIRGSYMTLHGKYYLANNIFYYSRCYVNSSGENAYLTDPSTCGYRPAFVLSLA